jgi:hypothetical protein
VFDLSKQSRFKEINEWFHESKRNQEAENIFVGNKKDQKRKISEEEAKSIEYLKKNQMLWSRSTDKA